MVIISAFITVHFTTLSSAFLAVCILLLKLLVHINYSQFAHVHTGRANIIAYLTWDVLLSFHA